MVTYFPAAAVRLACVALLTVMPPAMALASTPQEQARDDAFERMYNAPTDRDAMLDYARASIALRDFEAAMAVLERLVALEPDNAEARRQLALAQFALGSDELAAQTLRRVLDSGDEAAAARAEPYLRAAEARAAPSNLSGSVSLGGTLSSNAADRGAEAGLTLSWRHDLGTAGGATWLTRFSVAARNYADRPDDPERRQISLRSGPVLRTGPNAESAVLHPYLLLSTARGTDGADTRRLGLGANLRARLGTRGGLVGELSAGALDTDLTDSGRFASLGLTGLYRLGEATTLSLRLSHEDRRGLTIADETERQATLDIWHDFRPGFAEVPRDWRVGGMLRGVSITSDVRDYEEVTAGVMARMWVSEQGFVDAALGRSRRSDTASTVGASNWVTLRMGWEF